jgi:hypothetical protein
MSEHDGLDEDGVLHLSDEFTRATCMLVSEVALLLEKRAAQMPEDEELHPYARWALFAKHTHTRSVLTCTLEHQSL